MRPFLQDPRLQQNSTRCADTSIKGESDPDTYTGTVRVYAQESHQVMVRSIVRRPRTTSILQTASSITIFAMCEAICSLVEDTSMLPNRTT